MHPVSAELIEQAWIRQCEMDEEETHALVARFLEEQPYVAAYLLAADENMEEGEESQLIPLATLVWELFTDILDVAPVVEGEALNEAEAQNIKLLEAADETSEEGMNELAEHLFTEYNQRPLLQFALEVLMSEHEEYLEGTPNRVGLELLYIKTVIDCLDR